LLCRTGTCIEYLDRCRQQVLKLKGSKPNAFDIADKAYDLTTDKFANLPVDNDSSISNKRERGSGLKRKGTNCCLYFNAFLRHVKKSFEKKPPSGELEREARAAKIMQGLVKRHFYFSLREASRMTDPFWSRYYWNVKDGKICVWMPVSLKGKERRKWLEENIIDPDLLRLRERKRIQAIINKNLGNLRLIPFNENARIQGFKENRSKFGHPEAFCKSLGKTVAQEKVKNIHRQRRSIRALGTVKLQRMIFRIFEDINCGQYKDNAVAKDFGLSKPTFSRFAGSRWNESESNIPDLWQNTAQVLSVHPVFKEAAMEAGVWEKVAATLNRPCNMRPCNE